MESFFAAIPDSKSVQVIEGKRAFSIKLSEAPLCLVADQLGRVWVGTDHGIGLIERNHLGVPEFRKIDLPFNENELRSMHFAFRYPGGVRLGNSRVCAQIEFSGSSWDSRIYRCQEDEDFYSVGREMSLL